VLLLGGLVVELSLGEVVASFLCFFVAFLWAFLVVVVELLLVVVVLSCDALLCDWGCSETLLDEPVVPFGLVEVAVPELGVWFCGVVVLWVWSGVTLLAGGFSGVPVVVEVDGLATLPLVPLLEDGDAED
jgi:hypothetical protein